MGFFLLKLATLYLSSPEELGLIWRNRLQSIVEGLNQDDPLVAFYKADDLEIRPNHFWACLHIKAPSSASFFNVSKFLLKHN